MSFDTPFNDTDLESLDEFRSGYGVMSIAHARRLLCRCVIQPNLVMPDQMLRWV